MLGEQLSDLQHQEGLARYEKAMHYLDEIGLKPLSLETLHPLSLKYIADIKLG